MIVNSKRKNSGIIWSNNIWSYALIFWIIIWITGIIAIFLKLDSEVIITFGIFGFPLILCALLIPLIIFYNKSNLAYVTIRKTNNSDGFIRPKIITGLCYLYVPISIFSIIAIILFPNSFKRLGNEYELAYPYITAFIFLLYLFSLLGYWFMKKWAVYLYSCTFICASIIYYFYFNMPIKIFGFLGNLLIITIGVFYILRHKQDGK